MKPEDGKPCSLKQTVPEPSPPSTDRLMVALAPTLITAEDGLVESVSSEPEVRK
jgi:hypothetical protein